MTPEEAALLAEDLEQTIISIENIEEALPLTEGDGSLYRKDETTGQVNHEKVVTGAEHARVNFKMSMPKLQGPDFKNFIDAAKHLKETGVVKFVKTYSDDDIEKVKTDGIIGAMANEIIKKKHGQK